MYLRIKEKTKNCDEFNFQIFHIDTITELFTRTNESYIELTYKKKHDNGTHCTISIYDDKHDSEISVSSSLFSGKWYPFNFHKNIVANTIQPGDGPDVYLV